ncbi:MAG: mitochondrial import receptor protein [Thelocarpon superellum]|nr:MAG: mitochondrial import receptor protein [Thelocarpon superellum]
MVRLTEVEDEHFTTPQPGPAAEDINDDEYSDTDSEISSASSDRAQDETLLDRLVALRDVIPPTQRAYLSSSLSTGYRWVTTGLTFGGKTLWVVSTGAMMVGIPWALAFSEEAQMMEMEKEMKMQQNTNELLAPGASQQALAGGAPTGAKPAL